MNGEDATNPTVVSEEERLRAGAWSLLGHLLEAPPSAAMLELLCGIHELEVPARDAMANAWSTLRLAAERAQPDTLEQEYQDVFIGVGGGQVTPYASWYLTGSLLERPLVALRQDLEALGIERAAKVSEPEDYAAAICQAMALVITDPEVDFDWQRDFFRRHIEQWLGRLCNDIQKAPSAAFYRAVGCVGEEFHRLEQRYFAMLS